MKTCKNCQSTLPEAARFCPQCGAPVEENPACPNCGNSNPPDAHYCSQCGTALSRKKAQPSRSGERAGKARRAAGTLNPYLTVLLVGFLAMVVATVYNFQLLNKEKAKLAQQASMPSGASESAPANQTQFSPEELQAHIEIVAEKLKENPDDEELNIHMGNLLFDSGRYQEAIPYYKKALLKNPKNPDVIVDLGVCYFNLGEFEEAHRQFERALQVDPNHVNALYNKGIVAVKLQRFQELMDAWGKLVEVAPNSPQARQAQQILDEIHQSAQQP